MSAENLVSLLLLVGGVAVAGVGLALLWRREPRKSAPGRSVGLGAGAGPSPDAGAAAGGGSPRRRPGAASIAALVLAAVGLAIGLEGIERRGMSHVEVYVPGIDLPADISEPPPRHDLRTTVSWHWHREPHPQAYYFLMWGWTKLFGTDLTALRLPSLLFGAASVLLIFAVGRREYGADVGLLAAGLLAFNGHQIYWSQHARMYAMSMFLGLLSLWFLIRVLRAGRRAPWMEAGYVGATTAGVYTQLYFWPFLAAQMLWALIARRRDGAPLRRLFSLQALCVILGSPMWTHAVYQARHEPQDATSLAFAQDFLNFGFLFRPDDWSLVPRDIPWLPEAGLTVLALAAVWLFFRSRRHARMPESGGEALAPLPLFVLAAGFALIIVALAREASRRNTLMAATALVPLLAASGATLFARLGPVRAPLSPERSRSPWLAPVPWAGLGTAALVMLMGLFEPFLTPRGMLVALPPLLVVLAVGLRELARWAPAAGVAVLVAVAGAHVASILYYRELPAPNDYRALASAMTSEFESEDVILVRGRDWVTTPIFYHLQGNHHRLIARNHAEEIERRGVDRVWVLRFSRRPLRPDVEAAVDGFEAAARVEALRSEATLYRRPARSAAPDAGAAP